MGIVKRPIMPMPRNVEYTGGEILICKAGVSRYYTDIAGCENPVFECAANLLKDALTGKGCLRPSEGGYRLRLAVDPDYAAFNEHAVSDAYALKITENGIELIGYDAGGALYAVQTFLQLIYDRGDEICVPCVSVIDWPSFKTRGLFIEDRYGSDFLTKEDWFKAIDYFAQMKLNTLTVGVYGCWCQQFDGMVSEFLYVPFKSRPELKTPRHLKYYSVKERRWIYRENVLPTMYEEDYLGDIIAYAKQRNIAIKPLFNSYGHNTLLPRMIPELSAKDEEGRDTGFGVCTSSDRTYEIMCGLYDEIIDRYLIPNGIDAMHIGLDEVWEGIGMDAHDPFKFHTPFCKCEKCRDKERSELMLQYIIRICKHLKEKGLKSVYVYHDMLQYEFDVLHEPLVERLKAEGLYDTVVIDWWDYAHESKIFPGNGVNSLFRSIIKSFTGYYHWSTPLEYLNNIRGCARLARDNGFEGMEAYSSLEYSHDRSYRYMAELAWNTDMLDNEAEFLARYAEYTFPGADALPALSEMGAMMDAFRGKTDFTTEDLFHLDYYPYSYVNAGKPYPRRFPEEAFEKIHADLEKYEKGFEALNDAAADAVSYFGTLITESNNYFMASTWYAMAQHIFVTSGEYLGLLALERVTDPEDAVGILEEMLRCRETLMFTNEDARITGNSYMYLRIQSIYRQVLADLLVYARKCLEEDREFKVDMTDLSGITGSMLRALR